MGKVVVLGGNARSGKSTLAYMLQKVGFNRISLDLINTYIEDGLDIKFDDLTEEKQFNIFKTIIDEAVNEANNENINIVIDMYDYLPKDINKLENKNNIETYFLAYPNCTKEEIKYNVVHFAKPTDWIAQVNEEYLNECVERFYDRNQMLVEECKKYNMNLIDTKSGKDRDVVLHKLFSDII